jgi:RNA polymerase sigma-70 factor (ECF subfamily)
MKTVTYCVIPEDLAETLHDLLRRHFRATPGIEVVVERRSAARRARSERRVGAGLPADDELRAIRNPDGRRVGERRALTASVLGPPLPPGARAHTDRIGFFEALLPPGLGAEDLDTGRLVTRFQAGDPGAFEAIYLRYFDRVYAYLKVALRGADDAEDVAQQVFLKALEGLPRYERRAAPFRAWLFVIVRRHALDHLRRGRRLDVVDPEELDRRHRDDAEPDTSALQWLSDRELLVFVERLPLMQQQVLILRFMLDLRSEEIAQVLDLSAENVRVLQHRALGFLRERLGALGADRRLGRRARSRSLFRQAPVLRARRYALARPRVG